MKLRFELTCTACPEQSNIMLQKFKMSETELRVINFFSQFKRCSQLDFYYKQFEKLLSDIEKNFKPHISYDYAKPPKIESYRYEFWLSKTMQLSITKQKDPDKWNWFVSLRGGFHDCYLFTSGLYYLRYGDRGFDWKEKGDLTCKMPNDYKEKCKQALDKLVSVYKAIKNNYDEYIELLNTKLVSYKKREGVISRKTYIELNRRLPEDNQDIVSAWLDAGANADLIQKCLKYLQTPIKYIDKVTTRQFFEACKAYYQGNPDGFAIDKSSKLNSKSSAKDWYLRFADGRDDGLRNVDEDSHEDYLEWVAQRGKFCFNGHHPWEIERGASVTLDAHLYIQKEAGKGYYFLLSFHHLKIPQLIKGFVRMRELGIPVKIIDYENVERLLKFEDYIGIVEEYGNIVYKHDKFEWAEKDFGKIFCSRHLPDKPMSFIRKIIWKPLEYNSL